MEKVKIDTQMKLGEVKLFVSNLQRSITFYREIVGMQVLKQDGKIAELSADGKNVLLILEEIPQATVTPPRTTSGLYHFALLLPTRKDLGVVLQHLIDSGIHIGQADHLVSEALYISDPDHHGIEIYRDRRREEWARDVDGSVRMANDPIDWEGLLAEGSGEEWKGLPEGTVMGHVHLHVSSLEKSKAFYCDVLGLDVEFDWRRVGALFVAAGGYHHHVGLNVWAGQGTPLAPANGTRLAYYTIVLTTDAEVQQVLARLNEAKVDVTRVDTGWVVKDPSGIEIKITTV